MALTFNLRHLDRKPLHLEGALAPDELELTEVDEMIQLPNPFCYVLDLERLSQSVLVRGSLAGTLNCQCVRCLQPFTYQLKLEGVAWDLALEGEEKIIVNNDCVDLTPYLREDILLAFPQHPLCEPDCRGLKTSGVNLQEPAQAKMLGSAAASAWAELNKLKF